MPKFYKHYDGWEITWGSWLNVEYYDGDRYAVIRISW